MSSARQLNDSLADLVEKGGVAVEEVLSKAVEKQALRARLRSLLAS